MLESLLLLNASMSMVAVQSKNVSDKLHDVCLHIPPVYIGIQTLKITSLYPGAGVHQICQSIENSMPEQEG